MLCELRATANAIINPKGGSPSDVRAGSPLEVEEEQKNRELEHMFTL
jgi:hypothetical protein